MLGLQTRRGSNHSTAHVSESNSRSNVFQISRASACVPSRWKVLSGEFRRPTDFRTLYGLKWATSVEKRHGLPISEALRCSACAHPFACPGGWKVLSGEFRRRPTALVIKFRKPDRVGRRGLSEPREDFSRLITYAFLRIDSVDRFRGSIPWIDSVARFRGSIPWIDSVARFRGCFRSCKSCANSPPSNRQKNLQIRLDLLFIRLHNNALWSPKLNVTAKSSS